jgi:DNA-binding PadR family transcriptional regulator
MSKAAGKVPRGFTRYYVLYLLSKNELTGKDIIDKSFERSEGEWSPSPGLIYPLLGRLVRDGLITELEGGKFTITDNGLNELAKKDKFQKELEDQLTLVNKLGLSMFTAGRFLADEAIDRINRVSSITWEKLMNRSEDAQRRFEEKYKQFLLEELERLKRKKAKTSSDKKL